jgi:hypothetical protein
LIAKELIAKELIAKELNAKELIAKELNAKELIAKELIARELIAKELIAKELIAVNNSIVMFCRKCRFEKGGTESILSAIHILYVIADWLLSEETQFLLEICHVPARSREGEDFLFSSFLFLHNRHKRANFFSYPSQTSSFLTLIDIHFRVLFIPLIVLR